MPNPSPAKAPHGRASSLRRLALLGLGTLNRSQWIRFERRQIGAQQPPQQLGALASAGCIAKRLAEIAKAGAERRALPRHQTKAFALHASCGENANALPASTRISQHRIDLRAAACALGATGDKASLQCIDINYFTFLRPCIEHSQTRTHQNLLGLSNTIVLFPLDCSIGLQPIEIARKYFPTTAQPRQSSRQKVTLLIFKRNSR
jgi:hypothetical protein